jgi:iron complex outermembrane receptor protein
MKTLQALAASLTLSVSFAGMAGPVSAQDEAETSNDVTVLDAIVITGLKGTDAVKELPVSVSVIPGDGQIADAIDPGAAITRAAPNFYFGGFAQPGVDFVNMRGIGPLGQPSNSLDNSVGFSTNGAATSAFGFPPSLLDIERIEVIRGPQGTLFGRNALGGVVNVVTRPADGERELKIRGEVGTDGHHLAEITAGGWLQENALAGRFAARLNGVSGTIPNIVVGGEEGDTRLAAARGTLSYSPTDHFRVNLTLGFDAEQRHNNYNMLLETPGFPVSGADIIPDNRRKRGEATLEIQRDLEAARFTSLTNFQRIRLDGEVDTADDLVFQNVYGFIPPHGADISLSHDTDTIFSQEFRLSSIEGEPIK